MNTPINYIATWFYKESDSEASFYPQLGGKGNSALVHSIYMQIQIPFFITFNYYNPEAVFYFFTNLKKTDLPPFLTRLFTKLNVHIITIPYTCKPPKGWYKAWQNQFYLYDILAYMGKHINDSDTLLVCDADCLCRKNLNPLMEQTRANGSALYEFITDKNYNINGIKLAQIEEFYEKCYQQKPQPLAYYGGEFICLRGDTVKRINQTFPDLWKFNLTYAKHHPNKLNEEAHVLSVLAEHLHFRNNIANHYVKRMWTNPQFNNVKQGDENYAVWHLPYEKKRGLYYLFHELKNQTTITNETLFWKKAMHYVGIPHVSCTKRIKDRITTLLMKLW